jgi:photosystem II stability/assembly factor-like uncharacterized protein
MKNLLIRLAFFLAIGSTFQFLGAQQAPIPRAAADFTQFQKELNTWTASPANRQQKGWKTLSRWVDYEAKRMNPDQSSGDPHEWAATLQDIAATKAASAKTASSGWLPIGPNNYALTTPDWVPGIGRINCIAFHPTNGDIFWVGVAQGGVWRTNDGGQSWTPLTDDMPMLRISDIAVNPQNPNEIYICVGDFAYFGAGLNLDNRKRHTHYGLGVYKTVDGGASWNPTGLSVLQTDFDFSLTRRVIIHPSNPSALVAAGTHGIYTSSNAGNTWTQINDSLIWDLERDPANPNVLYAATGYRASLNVGNAGILKSTNFGVTWTALPVGIPAQGAVQRIEIAISPSNPNTVYALCAGMDAGFYALLRSTNAGGSWTTQSNSPNILEWGDGNSSGGQGWYDLALLVHPTNPDRIFTGGINMWGSSDGGSTWDGVSYWLAFYGPTIHADQHQLAYNPASGKYYMCNDGGLYGTDSLRIGSWSDTQNVPGYQWPTVWSPLSAGMQTTSFYRVGTSRDNPDYVIAGAQDNSTYFWDKTDWYNIFGGDGMECFIDPVDPLQIYGSSQYGNLSSSPDGGITQNWAGNVPEQGEWTTPWQLDPTDRTAMYAAFGNVWRSADGGNTWAQLSNFPINAYYGHPNISCAMDIAPSNTNYIYVAKRPNFWASDVGSMWVTTDGGVTWIDRTLGLSDSLYITDIAVDATTPSAAWLTMGGFLPGNKVFKTTDAGATWTNVSANLPNLPVNTIIQDPVHAHSPIYVGMDVGVWYRNDTMSAWQLYATDLPNVVVSDLEVHVATQRLYAATFGRGLWRADLRDATGAAVAPGTRLQLQLFPNPSDGLFRVAIEGAEAAQATLAIVNTLGVVVHRQDLTLNAGGQLLDLQQHSAGIYYLDVQVDGQHLTRKFVLR